jgi:hypothetical protein
MPTIVDSVKLGQSLRIGKTMKVKIEAAAVPAMPSIGLERQNGDSTTAYKTIRRQTHGTLIPHK